MSVPKVATEAPSLREAHKSRTRAALREAALKLFATQGYDATTTEEIARKARVSVRTFFRYYPTKESVLFWGERAWVESFAETFRSQPDSLSDVDAMAATLVDLVPKLNHGRLRLYKRAVASSPTLQGLAQDHQRGDMEELASAIASRRGLRQADEACVLLATVGVLTYVRALDVWLAGPASAEAAEIIADEFRLLAEQFTGKRATPARRQRRGGRS